MKTSLLRIVLFPLCELCSLLSDPNVHGYDFFFTLCILSLFRLSWTGLSLFPLSFLFQLVSQLCVGSAPPVPTYPRLSLFHSISLSEIIKPFRSAASQRVPQGSILGSSQHSYTKSWFQGFFLVPVGPYKPHNRVLSFPQEYIVKAL